MSALQFEALKLALKQNNTGYVLTLKVHPDDMPEDLMRDFVGARYMVAMVRVNDDETAVPVKNNRVQMAGMLCRSPAFQKFCNDMFGEEVSETGATKALYEVCGIQSRTELNGNKEAKEAFDRLIEEFERKSNDPF